MTDGQKQEGGQTSEPKRLTLARLAEAEPWASALDGLRGELARPWMSVLDTIARQAIEPLEMLRAEVSKSWESLHITPASIARFEGAQSALDSEVFRFTKLQQPWLDQANMKINFNAALHFAKEQVDMSDALRFAQEMQDREAKLGRMEGAALEWHKQEQAKQTAIQAMTSTSWLDAVQSIRAGLSTLDMPPMRIGLQDPWYTISPLTRREPPRRPEPMPAPPKVETVQRSDSDMLAALTDVIKQGAVPLAGLLSLLEYHPEAEGMKEVIKVGTFYETNKGRMNQDACAMKFGMSLATFKRLLQRYRALRQGKHI